MTMKQKIQIALGLLLLVVTIRTGYIFYQRHEANKPPAPQQEVALPADYYVVPRRLRAYDLKSARHLMDQPVWVKQGYQITYYPYKAATHRVDFSHEAGLLLPIEKLQITDVVMDAPPKGQKQVMAVFANDDKMYAFPVGVQQDGEYQIFADNIVFIQDPRELYKHWPADVWTAINQHEVKPGMNELQADFAVGMGVPDSGENPKTVHYANGGKPVIVVYQDGKAVEIKPDKTSS
jgi:hypothetical protein